MEDEIKNEVIIKINTNIDDTEKKLEKIKKLLEDIKISAQEVKDLFKHLF